MPRDLTAEEEAEGVRRSMRFMTIMVRRVCAAMQAEYTDTEGDTLCVWQLPLRVSLQLESWSFVEA